MPTPKRAQKKRAQKQAPAPPREEVPSHENPLLPHAKLRQIYLTMLQCEQWERRLAPHARTMRGLEAVLATLVVDLQGADKIGPCSLENELQIARGFQQPLAARALSTSKATPGKNAELRSNPSRAASRPLPEGARWSISTGVALAQKLSGVSGASGASGTSGAAVLLSRCPSREIEGCRQALTFAAANQLPMLYAIWRDTGAARASASSAIVGHAHACNIPVITVDGTDAVAMYRVVQECLQRARNGDGPTLIECVGATRAKTGPSETPLRQMERYLTGKRLFTKDWKREQMALLATPRSSRARSAATATVPST